MTLWEWAVAVWAKPGVEDACLALQDVAGQSVVLILWRAWLERYGRAVARPQIERAISLARAVEDERLKPLRAARRSLSRSDAGYGRLREQELAAERALIESLEGLPVAQPSKRREDLATVLVMLMEQWSGTPAGKEARALVSSLCQALG